MDIRNLKIGFIGGGNMAITIGRALLKQNVVEQANTWVSAPSVETLNKWKNLGVCTTHENEKVFTYCDVTILAVKPQMLDAALHQIERLVLSDSKKRIFISILVGVTLDTLQKKIWTHPANYGVQIVRAMPNTPMLVEEGITVYCHADCKDSQRLNDVVCRLFSCMGVVEAVPEYLMNPIGALSGSGPAYVYMMIEALADGAVRVGVPRNMAMRFAAQVMVGGGKMVLQTGKHPSQLKDEVCSPGGTSITGIHAMEQGGVRGHLMNAIEAAVKRSKEMNELNEAQKK